MMWRSMCLALVTIVPATMDAQELPTPPSENVPQIWVARAFEKDGGVVVALNMPVLRPLTDTVEAEVNGEKVAMTRVRYEFVQWEETKVKFDGKAYKAFGTDGKAIDPKDLLKRLSEATQVAVLLHHPATIPKLDTYYLRVLREDMVVFTAPTTVYSTFPRDK